MSYVVTIEADTVVELGGKLLALAAAWHPGPAAATANPVMTEVKEAAKPGKPKTAASATVVEPSPEATSGAASADAPSEEKSSASGEPNTADSAAPAVTDDVLRDLVIGLVKAKGREVMPPILAQFGVAKATEITDPATRMELANALRDAMGD